jgi:hypothetical protein
MWRLIGIWIVLTALAGCSNSAQDAEDQYNIVAATNGTMDQKCEAAQKVRDAWLEKKNQTEYQRWDAYAGIDCTKARLDRLAP